MRDLSRVVAGLVLLAALWERSIGSAEAAC